MPSTIVKPTGVALRDLITAIALQPEPKVYYPAPARITKLPAIVIEPPELVRGGVDQAELEIGSDAWTMLFPVVVYVGLAEADVAQDRAVEFVEAVIAAIDDSPTLNGLAGVDDSALTEAEPVFVEPADSNTAKPMFAYRCTVEVLRLVAT